MNTLVFKNKIYDRKPEIHNTYKNVILHHHSRFELFYTKAGLE